MESHYPQFVQLNIKYLEELNRYYRGRIEEIIANSEGLAGNKLTEYLTAENQKTVKHTKKLSDELFGKMFIESIKMSKLTFSMDKNL